MVSAAGLDCRGASDAQVWPEAAHKRMVEPVVEQTANEIVVAVPGEDDIINTNRDSDNPRRDRAAGKDVPRKNRCLNWRWIVPLVLLVVVIVVLVVDLALKPEPADIDHNWVSLRQFSMPTANSSSPALNSSRLHLVLETVLVISNPNLVGRFQYYDGGVYLFYHGRQAGHAPIPPGAIPTQRSRNLSALVSTNSESAALVAEEDAVLPFSTETNMTGFVRTWAVFKQHFQLASVCEVLLSMQSHTLVRYSCHDK